MKLISSQLSDSRKKSFIAAGCYYLLLLSAWAFLELNVMTSLIGSVPEVTAEIIKEIVLKLPIWFLPAFILSRRFDSKMYARKKEMFSFKKSHAPYLLIIIAFAAHHAMLMFRFNGGISIKSGFSFVDVVIAASVGLSEEMVFRGYLLNAALKENNMLNNIIAAACNSILFLMIHFPVWYRKGVLITYLSNGSFIQIIVLSLIFSFVFIKTKSIVIPAILHMVWDVLCFMQ